MRDQKNTHVIGKKYLIMHKKLWVSSIVSKGYFAGDRGCLVKENQGTNLYYPVWRFISLGDVEWAFELC